MKVIKSLENTGILLIGTTTKTTSQEGGFLNFLRPLKTASLPLMKNVLNPLGKSVLILLGLTTAMPATDVAVFFFLNHGSGTKAITSNEEMEDKMKIVKSLEKSRLIIKGIIETIKNEVKEQKGRFLSILLGTLPASIIGNILTGKGVIRAGEGVIRPG